MIIVLFENIKFDKYLTMHYHKMNFKTDKTNLHL